MTQAASSHGTPRLRAFELDRSEVALLGELDGFARDRLPGLLASSHAAFSEWPAIQRAVQDGNVHRRRVAHWQRVVAGRLDDGFEDSARDLAQAFHDHDVPGYAVAVCHASVLSGIVQALGWERRGFRRLGRSARRAARLRRVLTKLVWLDLELLLETYAAAEQRARAASVQAMAARLERETSLAVEQVGTVTGEVGAVATAITETAGRTGGVASRAVADAERTRSHVGSVSEAARLLGTAVDEIGRQVLASRAVSEQAVRSGQDTETSITELAHQASEIGQIAETIAGIAAQTNLLALNATIEAARAGDAGRGFAVVAGEVKSLANETARSTEHITRQIAAVREATERAIAHARRMVSTIGDVERIGAAVATAVREQGAAAADIVRNVDETLEAVILMGERTESVRAAASETEDQASAVHGGAQRLDVAVDQLRRSVVEVIRSSTSGLDRRDAAVAG